MSMRLVWISAIGAGRSHSCERLAAVCLRDNLHADSAFATPRCYYRDHDARDGTPIRTSHLSAAILQVTFNLRRFLSEMLVLGPRLPSSPDCVQDGFRLS